MSDQTYGAFVCYGATDAQLAAAQEILTDLFRIKPDDGWRLRNGQLLEEGEVDCGWIAECLDRLEDALGEETTWQAWEDPAYEYLGDVYLHSRRLGTNSRPCAAGGEIVLAHWQVVRFVDVDTAFARRWVTELRAARRLWLLQPPDVDDRVQLTVGPHTVRGFVTEVLDDGPAAVVRVQVYDLDRAEHGQFLLVPRSQARRIDAG